MYLPQVLRTTAYNMAKEFGLSAARQSDIGRLPDEETRELCARTRQKRR